MEIKIERMKTATVIILLALLCSAAMQINIQIENKKKTLNLNTTKFNFQFNLTYPDLDQLSEKDQTETSEFLVKNLSLNFQIKQAKISPGLVLKNTVNESRKNYENEESTWIGLNQEVFTINRTPLDRLIIYDKNGELKRDWELEE